MRLFVYALFYFRLFSLFHSLYCNSFNYRSGSVVFPVLFLVCVNELLSTKPLILRIRNTKICCRLSHFEPLRCYKFISREISKSIQSSRIHHCNFRIIPLESFIIHIYLIFNATAIGDKQIRPAREVHSILSYFFVHTHEYFHTVTEVYNKLLPINYIHDRSPKFILVVLMLNSNVIIALDVCKTLLAMFRQHVLKRRCFCLPLIAVATWDERR